MVMTFAEADFINGNLLEILQRKIFKLFYIGFIDLIDQLPSNAKADNYIFYDTISQQRLCI
jgi:hypothetical protein